MPNHKTRDARKNKLIVNFREPDLVFNNKVTKVGGT